MLSHIRILFSTIFMSILFLGSSTFAGTPKGKLLPLEPVWEKVGGQWRFNHSGKAEKQILIHITSSTQNTHSKKLLIKELVKLPFIVILQEKDWEIARN
tara:strand:+ start:5290 stop:5586 length:297 start_codon:yes stop_codon:yes gene_type:complete